MALTPITPRDRVQRLVDLGRKTWRYWWLIAVFAVVGGALSLAFAVLRPRNFQSWSTLFYQERIQSSVLSPGREESSQRNIGDRYRELLLSRSTLEEILADPQLDPHPEESDPEVKLEKLRLAVKFAARGAGAFRIEYVDRDPDRAKRVTEKLTRMLREKEETLRNEQAAATVTFVTQQSEVAQKELEKRERELNEFLARHPEFVQDLNAGQSEGASIRATRVKPTAGNTRLSIKERQLQRIQARLDAPPNAPPVTMVIPPTPERIAAEQQVSEAQREVASSQRELDDALSRFTDKHPSAIKAQDRLANAREKLRRAQAALPPQVETIVKPATAEDRAKLEKERAQLEAEIREEQSKTGRAPETSDSTTDRVVQLESENSQLRRNVTEQRERVQALADQVFRATMDANQKLAEQGGRLSIVDPAFRPARPSGPGKTIFLLAGMVLFVGLGLSLAVALALIDDRLYRRVDLDQLGIAVLGVIPPARAKERKAAKANKAKPKAAATTVPVAPSAAKPARKPTEKPDSKRPGTGGVP